MCACAQACFGWALLGISSGSLHRELPLRHIHVRNRQIHWVSSPKCPNEDGFLYFEASTTAGEALYCPGPIFRAFSSSFSPGANPTIAGRGEGCRYLMFFYHFHQRLLFIPRLSPEAPRDKNSAVCLGLLPCVLVCSPICLLYSWYSPFKTADACSPAPSSIPGNCTPLFSSLFSLLSRQ